MQFADVIGLSGVKDKLISGVKEGRIAHAQLFMGQPGSGNLALALAYLQYIACNDRKSDDSCGACPSCRKIARLEHADLHLVYPIILSKETRISSDLVKEFREAFLQNPYLSLFEWLSFLEGENKQGVINVEESADILRKLSLTAYEGGYKMMIIWQPEKMNVQSANKLLKILEEPPDKTLFLLVTENSDQLLPTIVSRTQLVKVNRIADEDLRDALVARYGLGKEEAERIAYLADGSYSEARQLLSGSSDENLPAGQAGFNFIQFRAWMRLCFTKDVLKAQQWVEGFAAEGREKHKNFVAYALNVVREALMLNFGDDRLVRLQGEELDFVRKFAPYIHGENCMQITDEFNRAIQHIERNANPKILFTDLSMKMMALLRQPVGSSELKA